MKDEDTQKCGNEVIDTNTVQKQRNQSIPAVEHPVADVAGDHGDGGKNRQNPWNEWFAAFVQDKQLRGYVDEQQEKEGDAGGRREQKLQLQRRRFGKRDRLG